MLLLHTGAVPSEGNSYMGGGTVFIQYTVIKEYTTIWQLLGGGGALCNDLRFFASVETLACLGPKA